MRRPGSAEQAQFFSVFSVKRRQAGSDREVRVTLERRSGKKKTPEPRRTGAIYCVFPTNRGKLEASTKSELRMEGGVQKKKGKTSCTLYVHQLFQLFFFPNTGEDYNKHGFMARHLNICFYASGTYQKVIYLNVNKYSQLFWCFQMRMRTSFVNLVRLLPSEDKSHK